MTVGGDTRHARIKQMKGNYALAIIATVPPINHTRRRLQEMYKRMSDIVKPEDYTMGAKEHSPEDRYE